MFGATAVMGADQRALSARPCHPDGYSIRVIDAVSGQTIEGTVDALESSFDPNFRRYVVNVSDHILAKFGPTPIDQYRPYDAAGIKLVFVRLPLIENPSTPMPPLVELDSAGLAGDIYRLDSPWAKLAVAQSDRCLVRAMFVWSERQIVFDQALLAGISAIPQDMLKPIKQAQFSAFADDYAENVVEVPSKDRGAAMAAIKGRIPPEIVWLFSQAWQSTFGPFLDAALIAAANLVRERAVSPYSDLTIALIDRIGAKNAEQKYRSVVELGQFMPLEQLRLAK